MEHSLELLDRQVDFLLRQSDDATFLVQLDPFLRALESDMTLAAYLDDVRFALPDITQVMEAIDAELVPELVELRNELVSMRPSIDDADVSVPSSQRTVERFEYESTLAFFDEVASSVPRHFNEHAEGGRARTLLNILRGKDTAYGMRLESASTSIVELDSETGRPVPESDEPARGTEHTGGGPFVEEADIERLERWRQRLRNADVRLEHARRWMRLRVRTDAGLALLKLEAAREALNPPAKLIGPDYTVTDVFSDTVKWIASLGHLLFTVADGDQLGEADARAVSERVSQLRADADRLQEELHRRVGATRSRLAMVNRFKLRCEWHDRQRMADVASDGSLSGGPEDRLTAELARYLFDQGLSPLTRPMTGGLQPDLLDPNARFYVEAKQYKRSARSDITEGFAQVVDTANKLRGDTHYQIEEAFCVIFRLSGPYYLLPSTVEAGELRVHFMLVDLAPPSETGRRQKDKPVAITAEELIEACRQHAGGDPPGDPSELDN